MKYDAYGFGEIKDLKKGRKQILKIGLSGSRSVIREPTAVYAPLGYNTIQTKCRVTFWR